jgi:copper(I)-binding protein
MIRMVTRRNALQLSVGMGAALSFKGASAHEFFSSSLTVHHPWTRASAEGASTAIVSVVFDDVVRTDTLIGAESPVCEGAELGGVGTRPDARLGFEFVIPEGQTTELAEGGTYLRLLGLKFPLQLGREYPMTLIFAKAGPLKAALLIDFPPLS